MESLTREMAEDGFLKLLLYDEDYENFRAEYEKWFLKKFIRTKDVHKQ